MPISKSLKVFTDEKNDNPSGPFILEIDDESQCPLHPRNLGQSVELSAHERAQFYKQQELQSLSLVQQIYACIIVFCPCCHFLPVMS